ncbi:LysR substrate-binding domain-containing protein [Paenirhodobacter populi]|uniref:LysR substrate-binding domain-containing protein n=1 Tax=Paenirhodobacter populi TaxID=2306993 RepID=UPI000FE3C477|nr:LysR substrate-binding domain-containing protein [Sinirhodobacter populi]RWR08000.1 LysR family transcriptional regulator [Sinirhodobacter populi]
MTLRELQYLVALARQKNFRRAAEICNVSQPTLSTQIRKLEEELGLVLVERGTREALLTAAGEEIVARAQRILNEAQDIHAIAERHRSPEAGRLRLGVFPTLGPYLLPSLVPKIAARFPKLELQLIEEKSDQLLQKLAVGQLDAALLALPVGDDTLEVTPLFDEPFLLAVPPGHPLTLRPNVCLEDMNGQKLMLLEDGHCLRDQAISLCRRWGAGETSGFRATSLETLRQMVAAGMGITLMPMLAARGPLATNGNLRFLPFREDPPPSRSVGMVWRRSSALLPVLRQIARMARDTERDLIAA